MKDKRMSKNEVADFLGKISRAEFSSRPIEYSKAVRVTLIALGYDEDWVNDEFRDMLEKEYSYFFKS